MDKETLIRDLCSVEFRSKSKTRELVDKFEADVREEAINECLVIAFNNNELDSVVLIRQLLDK